MGMTKVFYLVKKQFSLEEIRERWLAASASDGQPGTVYYQEEKDWLPVFDEYYCEGQYAADQDFMESLGEVFASPVIALSVFDSDVAFISVCKNGKLYRYVRASEAALEEFGFEEYEPVIPAELKDYVDWKEFEKLWDQKYVFEEDFLQDLAELMNTFLVFYEDNVEEKVEKIGGAC